jgi:hypothetical protein
MINIDPFQINWFDNLNNYVEIKPWFPLPSNFNNKGEE